MTWPAAMDKGGPAWRSTGASPSGSAGRCCSRGATSPGLSAAFSIPGPATFFGGRV